MTHPGEGSRTQSCDHKELLELIILQAAVLPIDSDKDDCIVTVAIMH